MSLVLIVILFIVACISFLIGSGTNAAAMVAAFVFFPTVIVLYFAPTLVAVFEKKRANSLSIGLLNLLTGWTGLGWIGALIWAYSNPASPVPTFTHPAPEPLTQRATKACPYCAEDVMNAAIKCRHCGSDLPADT